MTDSKDLAQRDESKAPVTRPEPNIAEISRLYGLIENPDIDADKAERIAAICKDLRKEHERRLATYAKTEVKKGMVSVPKRGRNPSTGSRYPLLEDIEAMLDPLLSEHGFSLTWGEEEDPREGWTRLVCTIDHVDGYQETRWLAGPLDVKGIKGTPVKTGIQGQGSTLTYLKRRLKALAFDVQFHEDDDGKAAGIGPEWQPVSKEQSANLVALLEETGSDEAKFCRVYGIKSVEELPKAQYAAALNMLEAKRRK